MISLQKLWMIFILTIVPIPKFCLVHNVWSTNICQINKIKEWMFEWINDGHKVIFRGFVGRDMNACFYKQSIAEKYKRNRRDKIKRAERRVIKFLQQQGEPNHSEVHFWCHTISVQIPVLRLPRWVMLGKSPKFSFPLPVKWGWYYHLTLGLLEDFSEIMQ